jgi:nicotinate phosphoribosyltransferase
VVALEDDAQPGEPLLAQVMKGGRRVAGAESLAAMRERAARSLAALPAPIGALDTAPRPYRVEIAPRLRALAEELDRGMAQPLATAP